ncbi:hypothetical protein F4780DRAFT_206470 [Xylariomycetidae sp. FL0641]|nr:hypothetical protein F4780DRAFT_206470 [Xylariomycetidae sp. FL0641]
MKDKPAEGAAEAAAEAKPESEKPAEAATSAEQEEAAGSAEGAAPEAENATPAGDKSKGRRKSTGNTGSAKGKKLNKKASKAKITHIDAKPGDHFFAKLKGFPPWPVVVCSEDMLESNMLNSRPVTAARPDGTYRDDFADGGRRVADRTFPVMYLHTNEFSWTPNTDLSDLDPETVADLIQPKMRKDLQNAHLLAAEHHDLEYYKNMLREFAEQKAEKEARAAERKNKKTPKKASKAAESAAADEDGDLEMPDADDDEAESSDKKKSKKRKAEEESNTLQRSDSVKKPKIKLTHNTTPKTANGAQSPTPAKDSAKSVKVKTKSKGGKEADSKDKEAAAPKEPELTPKERQLRKEAKILFLRHRLQKGLLLRDQEPKAEEMKSMSEFLNKLESFPDLEVSIIRNTKINKVLKAILKLEAIPKEEEFNFKPRSQTLLDKWNKILATDSAEPAPATANGVNGTAGSASKGEKEATNGVKETTEAKDEPEKESSKAEPTEKETKETAAATAATSANEEKPVAKEAESATEEAPAKVEAAA